VFFAHDLPVGVSAKEGIASFAVKDNFPENPSI